MFKYWGIGKKERDNGILVLISKGDRRIEIETGYGLAKILSDEKVSQIVETEMIPYFKQEKFDEGAIAGVNTIVNYLDASVTTSSYKPLPVEALLVISGILILLGSLFILAVVENKYPQEFPRTSPIASS
ncbi:MAG: TPM domain-containing protein [Hydrococcus sp. Prado102]|nr:TPM domain-containing protein [Hydrococcus sp. Prado102]